MNRRGFLAAILATGMAPAIVKAANIMPVFVRSGSGLLLPQYAEFCAADLALSIEDFARRFLQPSMAALAKRIDDDICREMLLGRT